MTVPSGNGGPAGTRTRRRPGADKVRRQARLQGLQIADEGSLGGRRCAGARRGLNTDGAGQGVKTNHGQYRAAGQLASTLRLSSEILLPQMRSLVS